MRAFTAILLKNSLSAILEHIEQTAYPDPALLELKSTIEQRIQQFQIEDPSSQTVEEIPVA